MSADAERSTSAAVSSTTIPRSFAFRLTHGRRRAPRRHAAAAAGTTPGEWARETVSAALGIAYRRRSMRRRVANADLLRQLLGELGRQGGNLNQATARLNAERDVDALAARHAIEAIRAGQASVVAAILAALGGTDEP